LIVFTDVIFRSEALPKKVAIADSSFNQIVSLEHPADRAVSDLVHVLRLG
jgi:hypothetical protein